MSDVQTESSPRKTASLNGALLRYKILAYIVGTALVILIPIGVPVWWLTGSKVIFVWDGTAHGWLFMVYLVLIFDLARRAGWSMTRVVLVGLAGFVPFVTFYAERRVVAWVRADQAEELTD